ncbi:hypothetical protein T02_5873 [Trichinella nativa]|uniref:Uncharacterized protein n=1 Tax=Trichinella nativa TaxID=6335 RepID=A0A0V1LM68_9BILA|nr:hypothetical protein T02_5873 [Trichinella nativa]
METVQKFTEDSELPHVLENTQQIILEKCFLLIDFWMNEIGIYRNREILATATRSLFYLLSFNKPFFKRRFEVKRKKKRSVLCCVFGWCLLRTQNGQLKHACLLVQHLLICDKSNLSSSAE